MPRLALAAAALCAVCWVAAPPAALGYSRAGTPWAQVASGGVITYSYNNFLDGGLKGPDGVPLSADYLRGAIEEALGAWASVAPLHFVEVADRGGDIPNTEYPNGQFGVIRLHHLYINGPDIPGHQPISKAIAYLPSPTGNRPGDVLFDHGDPWQVVGTQSTPDPLGAAIHEIGHALGLGHSQIPEANMYWIFKRHTGPGSAMLHADDIAGIRAVYGAGVGSVTPLRLAVPEPAAATLAGALALVGLWARRGAGRR